MMLNPDKLFGHYKLQSAIGSGGMGEVFLAEDTRLNRLVAIKFLAEEFSRDADRLRRFMQEARAASALNHPNIITIHEIGKADEKHFIATEYIDGETLRVRLENGHLPLSEVLSVAVQTAEALAAAHAAGIVHRDIKPENIMLRADGYVKVLDFGLAKLTERQTPVLDSEAQTRALQKTADGVVLGTLAYMSPEQSRGKQIDERTDIWSLGVVLYEMLAGHTPFAGETMSDIIAAIIKSEPPPIESGDEEIPHELQRIVRKILQKNADERYQTAKDLLVDLKTLRRDLDLQDALERTIPPARKSEMAQATVDSSLHVPTQVINATTGAENSLQTTSSAEYVVSEIKKHKRSFTIGLTILLLASIGLGYWFFANRSANAKQIESIAVLPFVNEGGNTDTEYLSDGMTESLINSLSQLPNMKVIARSSAFRYKGKDMDLSRIARELNVQAIINGRVVQRGDTLSISVELMDAQNNTQLWGRQFTRKSADIFALQDEITRQVMDSLRVRLTGAQEERVTKRYTDNEEAYKLYLQGRFHWNKRHQSLKKAVEYFKQAIEKDPNYALAYAGLAESYALFGEYDVEPPKESAPKGKAAALKALEIDPNLAEAYTALAYIKTDFEWDFEGAEKDYLKAIELNPKYATARQWYGEYLTQMGRFDEAAAQTRQAQEFDPLSPVINEQMSWLLMYQDQYDRAIESSRKTLELDPNFLGAYGNIGWAYEEKKMYMEAVAAYQKRRMLLGESQQTIEAFEEAYKKGGWKGYLQKELELNKEKFKQGKISAGVIAIQYALLGENEEALKWLEQSYENREDAMAWLKVEPAWIPLRSDPRFQDLMRRVGLPQ